MLRFQPTTTDQGRDLLVASFGGSELLDPLILMRMCKRLYPDLWAQVNLEIPGTIANCVNRIVGADGKPQGK
jgi:hypothetical protein